jgi:hypothetical protein
LPDGLHEFVLAQQFAGAFDDDVEELELPRLQGNWDAITKQALTAKVEPVWAEPQVAA